MDTEVFAIRMMELFPRIVKVFSRHEDNDLARGKITFPQFWVLYYLFEESRCKMKTLAGHLRVSPAAATGLVDRLIGQGLVARENEPSDRRVVWIVLSAKGRETIAHIRKQRIKAIIAVFGRLSAADRSNYLRILEKVARMTSLDLNKEK